MGTKYRLEHPDEPYDLSDMKGTAAEIAEEAKDEVQDVATAITGKVKDTASEVAEGVSEEAKAAYDDPSGYAAFTLRRLEARARAKPLDTLAVAGAIAFLAGALWGIASR
jgi:hypothetical protein